MKLSEAQRKMLERFAAGGWVQTSKTGVPYSFWNDATPAHRSTLKALFRRGLVTFETGLRTTNWEITPAGRRALQEDGE